MASVVFLRAVNVGGHKPFRPAAVARSLAHCGAVNIGAAGTFVIREHLPAGELRTELEECLPWECEMMICPGRDVLELTESGPFPRGRSFMHLRRFVSVLARKPAAAPAFPILQPATAEWQVRIVGLCGRFALSLWRRQGKTFVDPNAAVEKHFGVRATTRNWNTILRIAEQLQVRRS